VKQRGKESIMTGRTTSMLLAGIVILVWGSARAVADEASPTSAAGSPSSNPVSIHGFASQGFLKSSANNYLSVSTERGSFAFSEEALTVTALPVPNLRVAAQVFARDLGPQGNQNVTIGWALGDYRVRDWLGFRAGRVKMPVGLYNILVDADVARPEILQPGGVYPLSIRDITGAVDGGSLYGTVALGVAGALDYEVWGGTEDIDEAYIVRRFHRDGAAASLPALASLRIANLDYNVSEIEANMDHLYGGALEWRPPVAGLRLRASGFTAESNFSALTTYTGFMGPAPVSLATRSRTHYEQPYFLYASAEYQRAGLRLTAESVWSKARQTITVTGMPGPALPAVPRENRPVASYAQVAYRVTDRLQASTYYSVSYDDRGDKQGQRFVRTGQPVHRAWQKDLAFSGRLDITSHWLAKVEWHSFDGTQNMSVVENPQGLKQRWKLVLAKTTVHF
jgi:hypothetical protein